MSQVTVRIDDRVRLMSALLSITSWPDDEQARKPHGIHAHARHTRRFLELYHKMPATQVLQALLDRHAPLEAMYTFALQLTWPGLITENPPTWAPPTWARHLGSFYHASELAQWWEDEAHLWEEAQEDSQNMFDEADIKGVLQPFFGQIQEDLVFMPNISYPSDIEIGARVDNELWCIAPPRIAWGDNPPWPFDEDQTHIYRAVLLRIGTMLMHKYLRQNQDVVDEVSKKKLPLSGPFVEAYPAWEDQFTRLFVIGLVALYLEQAVSKQEADAYVLMETKAQGVKILPGVVSVLQRFLQGLEDGTYASFADYLPHFGKHLRVAKTITSL